MLAISLLAAVPGAAEAQTATVVAPAATVSGITVTNARIYEAQSVSAPSGTGQLSPTGTIGTASNWHFRLENDRRYRSGRHPVRHRVSP
jgi:hypothetical protein